MDNDVRLDKYLWAIRAFKTRNEATEACNGGKVKLNDAPVKPSKAVHIGDVLSVRKGAVQFTYKVVALLDKRVGASLVSQYAENLTPQSELDKMRAPVETFFLKRDRGAGRPTKKDRRTMEALWDAIDFSSMNQHEDEK